MGPHDHRRVECLRPDIPPPIAQIPPQTVKKIGTKQSLCKFCAKTTYPVFLALKAQQKVQFRAGIVARGWGAQNRTLVSEKVPQTQSCTSWGTSRRGRCGTEIARTTGVFFFCRKQACCGLNQMHHSQIHHSQIHHSLHDFGIHRELPCAEPEWQEVRGARGVWARGKEEVSEHKLAYH